MTPLISCLDKHSKFAAPDLRVNLEVDSESTLPMLLEGRTVAVLGRPIENHTAESVIPQRRLKIHEQLQRSRRLRASIESAANLVESLPSDSSSSFPNAISILKSSLQDINQLVRLTESLCGNYTLDDTYEYNEWSAWARRQNELENEKTKREQRIIRQQLRNFSRETNPNLELNDELEAMHDSLIEKTKELADGVDFTQEDDDSEHYDVPDPKTQRKDSVASRVRAGAQSFRVAIQDSSKPDRAQFHRQELSTENDATLTPQEKKYHRRRKRKTKSNDSRDLATSELVSSDVAAENNDVGIENNQQMKSKASKTSNPVDDKKPVAAKKSSPNENENVTSSKPGAAKISAPSPDASAPAKGTNTAKGRRKNALKVRPTKKCHHCKEQSTKYRNCNYWKLSGTKCPKAFCIECLSSKYTLGDDVQSPSNPDGIPIDEIIMCAALDLEWHCPSCLGTCLCATCVKQKKKEEEREKNRLEVDKLRKSSRRSGASYAGYNFM